MFQTVFNSQPVFIIDDAWDGNAPLEADFSLIRDDQSSLTKREARRSYSATLRVAVKYQATVHDAALRILQGSLRALNTQPVIVPLWPVISRWADRAAVPISGGLKIVWKEDWSQYEIYTTAEPAWPGPDDNVAPALYGFISPAEPTMQGPDSAQWSVEFTESSPADYALAPLVFVAPAGPQPGGYAFVPPLLPFQPDFSSVSEEISVEVKRDAIGLGRRQEQTFYPESASRSQKANYTLNCSQAAQLLRFFQDVAGPGAVFWSSGWLQVASLTQDAQPNDTVLHVEDTSALNAGDYVSLFGSLSVIPRKVIGKDANTITLDAAPGFALPVAGTCIFPLCLARMDKPLLRLQWKAPESVSCELDWTEVPAELIPAGDETISLTLGKLTTRIILFQFTRDFRNGTVLNWFYTSYESDVTYNGQVWASQNIQCGDISRGLNLEDDGVDVTTGKFPGNPLIDEITKRAEVPLSVAILFADFDGANVSNVSTEFTGVVSAPSRQGNTLKATCRFGPAVLDNQLPFFILGTICNHLRGNNPDGSFLFSPGCTLLRANWKFTAQFVAPISAAFPFTVNLSGLVRAAGDEPIYFDNWFAGGVIEWGAGANIQRRYITSSTTPVGSAFSITLHRYFNGIPNIGDTLVLYPGCDGLDSTCKAYDGANNPTGKFGNHDNFGAEPLMPVGNPSLVGQPSLGVQGGKK